MRQARSDYVNSIIESAFQESDTKPFWKFIKSKRAENTGVAPLKTFFVRTIPEWNAIPEASIQADTPAAFKASLCPSP